MSVCAAGNSCTDGVEMFLLLFKPCVSYAVMLDNMEITDTIYISIYISYCDAISCMGGAPIQYMDRSESSVAANQASPFLPA